MAIYMSISCSAQPASGPAHGQVSHPQSTRLPPAFMHMPPSQTDAAQEHESGMLPHGSSTHLNMIPSPDCERTQTIVGAQGCAPQGTGLHGPAETDQPLSVQKYESID